MSFRLDLVWAISVAALAGLAGLSMGLLCYSPAPPIAISLVETPLKATCYQEWGQVYLVCYPTEETQP